jgi:hypothetical protein
MRETAGQRPDLNYRLAKRRRDPFNLPSEHEPSVPMLVAV